MRTFSLSSAASTCWASTSVDTSEPFATSTTSGVPPASDTT